MDLILAIPAYLMHTEHEASLSDAVYHPPHYSEVSLFQVVSRSSSVTTPMLDNSNATMFVHHTERVHGMLLHTLNVFENTTNTEYIQTGWKDCRFSTKSVCTTFSFSKVRIVIQDLSIFYFKHSDQGGLSRNNIRRILLFS